MPAIPRAGLWEHQHRVIINLERSLARNEPRALIHMTMGSGKTFTACNFVYRLIAHAGARRVLFLVDRRTLGRQGLNEFQQFAIPGDGRKFTELYNVQLLSSNTIEPVCRVVITTIQRLYSILRGESGWIRCSFPVALFHPLQHAGLSRRTPTSDSQFLTPSSRLPPCVFPHSTRAELRHPTHPAPQPSAAFTNPLRL